MARRRKYFTKKKQRELVTLGVKLLAYILGGTPLIIFVWSIITSLADFYAGPAMQDQAEWHSGTIVERTEMGSKDYRLRVFRLDDSDLLYLLPRQLLDKKPLSLLPGQSIAILSSSDETFGSVWDPGRYRVALAVDTPERSIYSYHDYLNDRESELWNKLVVSLFVLIFFGGLFWFMKSKASNKRQATPKT